MIIILTKTLRAKLDSNRNRNRLENFLELYMILCDLTEYDLIGLQITT